MDDIVASQAFGTQLMSSVMALGMVLAYLQISQVKYLVMSFHKHRVKVKREISLNHGLINFIDYNIVFTRMQHIACVDISLSQKKAISVTIHSPK
jgi:hypothetical protein